MFLFLTPEGYPIIVATVLGLNPFGAWGPEEGMEPSGTEVRIILHLFHVCFLTVCLFVCFQIRSFNLENSLNCNKDFVEIREGNATGHLIGRYCGNSLPGNYSSAEGHSLWVRFVSDGSGTGMGFQARFKNSKMVCFRNGF